MAEGGGAGLLGADAEAPPRRMCAASARSWPTPSASEGSDTSGLREAGEDAARGEAAVR